MTRRTYNAYVNRYAKSFLEAFCDLKRFVETNCKGGSRKRDAMLDAISEIVDRYINLNVEVQAWCNKNGVNHGDCVCDIENKGFEEL